MLNKDFKEIAGTELVSMTGGVAAGFLLTFALDKLYLVPSLLILLPGFLEMRGNISGTLSARLTAGLYVGAMKNTSKRRRIIQGNLVASAVLVVILSLFLGVISYLISFAFFGINNTNIILIALAAGLLSNLMEIPITVLTTLWLFKKGHDPSNIMGPYITTVGDIVSIISLLIAIMVIA